MMPGNSGSPARSLRTRLSRISSFTERAGVAAACLRRSPSVWIWAAMGSILPVLRVFSSGRPLVFAHRGGSALAPENTIAAFDNGLRLGADGLELDVHLSRDGVVVVHHDRMLDRTTTLRGLIAERTAEELRRAGVPTLAEVLARYREPRVIVEMKVNAAQLAAAVVDV